MTEIPQEWVEKGTHVLLHGHPLLNKTESDRLARAVLAAVLPDVMAQAWDDGWRVGRSTQWGDSPENINPHTGRLPHDDD